MPHSFFSTYKQHQIQWQAEFFSLFYLKNIKRFLVLFLINLTVAKLNVLFRYNDSSSVLSKKTHPFPTARILASSEQNSRSPRTMTLYSENNGRTCCRFLVCSSKLLLPNLGNNDQYNGIALRSQIKLTMNRLIHPH